MNVSVFMTGTAKDKPNVSIGEAIHDACLLTKEEFMTVADRMIETTRVIGLTGSCCLVGIILGGTIWVANSGK